VNEDLTAGSTTRHRILQIALTLMSQRGVDGTSMRDLASACGLNVASLYHYFPSKRELLEAVLGEHGFLPVQAEMPPAEGDESPEARLATVLNIILLSMFEVEDFVRLMVGEAMRDEEAARTVGSDLFATFQTSIEDWIVKQRPDLDARSGAPAVAQLLSAMIVGIFVLHSAGVMDKEDDMQAVLLKRAKDAAQILGVFDFN
jgi:AcrR family transcriptional regulator